MNNGQISRCSCSCWKKKAINSRTFCFLIYIIFFFFEFPQNKQTIWPAPRCVFDPCEWQKAGTLSQWSTKCVNGAMEGMEKYLLFFHLLTNVIWNCRYHISRLLNSIRNIWILLNSLISCERLLSIVQWTGLWCYANNVHAPCVSVCVCLRIHVFEVSWTWRVAGETFTNWWHI